MGDQVQRAGPTADDSWRHIYSVFPQEEREKWRVEPAREGAIADAVAGMRAQRGARST